MTQHDNDFGMLLDDNDIGQMMSPEEAKDLLKANPMQLAGLLAVMNFMIAISRKLGITPEELTDMTDDKLPQKEFMKRLNSYQINKNKK